jgi:hypothetical protein
MEKLRISTDETRVILTQNMQETTVVGIIVT